MLGRSIKSAERTLAVLEYFSKRQEPLAVGTLSKALDVPQPSMSMLLKNLTDLGYLDYNRAARLFIPTIRVVLLGSWIERRFNEAHSIGTSLDRLQRAVGETAYVAIQNGAAGQYIVAQSGDAPNALNVESGQFRSLTCTAFGRALLALKPNAEILSWVTRCNAEAEKERYRVSRADFMKIIEDVRRKGYGETAGDQTPGAGALAMTFTSPVGQTPLAVGVGGEISAIQAKRDSILAALQAFCEEMESHRVEGGLAAESDC